VLTTEEIREREFLVSLRGYDRDEVRAFLDEVASQMDSLVERAGGAPAPARAPEPERVEEAPAPAPAAAPQDTSTLFAEIGKETQRILEAAHEAGSEIQRKARLEAERELKDARTQSAKIIAEGERRREVVEGLVATLEERRHALSDDLRGVGAAIERALRDLGPEEEAAPMREALAREAEGSSAGGGGRRRERPSRPDRANPERRRGTGATNDDGDQAEEGADEPAAEGSPPPADEDAGAGGEGGQEGGSPEGSRDSGPSLPF
jgi:DivIVA domain-containing protein